MTRYRRLKDSERPHRQREHGEKHHKTAKKDFTPVLSTVGLGLVMVIGLLLCVQYWSYSSIARVYQPLNEPKMVSRDLGTREARSMLWGTYR